MRSRYPVYVNNEIVRPNCGKPTNAATLDAVKRPLAAGGRKSPEVGAGVLIQPSRANHINRGLGTLSY
jgi:hypothetical protein